MRSIKATEGILLTKYTLDQQSGLHHTQSDNQILWYEISNPTSKERAELSEKLGIHLPNRSDLHQIEYSNRFKAKNGVFHFCIDVVTKTSPSPESHVISLILDNEKLITIRYTDIIFFNPLSFQVPNLSFPEGHFGVFLYILRKIIGANADIFEIIGEKADGLNQILIVEAKHDRERSSRLNRTLIEINYLRSLLSKAYHSISSINLLISFFKESIEATPESLKNRIDSLMVDIGALIKHSDHLTQKLEFQLQSTLGLINIQQTQIIKVFTVLAMIFMPPTLIASIYGMNFQNLPELNFHYGYYICLSVMFASSILPYRYFKMKGWI